jgi:hypothetical protein
MLDTSKWQVSVLMPKRDPGRMRMIARDRREV